MASYRETDVCPQTKVIIKEGEILEDQSSRPTGSRIGVCPLCINASIPHEAYKVWVEVVPTTFKGISEVDSSLPESPWHYLKTVSGL